jgi:hypothetical protein
MKSALSQATLIFSATHARQETLVFQPQPDCRGFQGIKNLSILKKGEATSQTSVPFQNEASIRTDYHLSEKSTFSVKSVNRVKRVKSPVGHRDA